MMCKHLRVTVSITKCALRRELKCKYVRHLVANCCKKSLKVDLR